MSPSIDVRADPGVAKVTLHGVPDVPGIAAEVFMSLGESGHNVDLVVSLGSGPGFADISFAVQESELARVLESVRRIATAVGAREVSHRQDLALVCIVGDGLARLPGVAGKMFRTLSRVGINLDVISTSVSSVTCLVPRERSDDAVAILQREFGAA